MFSFLAFHCLSVNKNNYYTCDEIEYCKRDRFIDEEDWKLIDFKSEKEKFIGTITKGNKTERLHLNITFHANDMIRIRFEPVEEKDFERYDISKEELIINQTIINETSEIKVSEAENLIKVENSKYRIEISKSPFNIIVYENNSAVLSLNDDNKAIFNVGGNTKSNNKYGDRDIALSFKFLTPETKLSGVPAHTFPIQLPDTKINLSPLMDPLRLFNTDINSFEVNSPMSMYSAIPYIIGRSGEKTTSILWLNAAETWIDIEKTTARFMSETGYIDLFIFSGTHSSVINSYTSLTGRPVLHPIFALGYHQCRWGYMDSDEIRDISKNLDNSEIPHDVMWLDLDHTNDKKYFTFSTGFHDMKRLQKEFFKKGRKIVALVDPHLAAKEDYDIYLDARDNGYFVTTETGGDLRLKCWPGVSAWPDYMNPEVRDWWSSLFEYENYKKSTKILHIWNDMNEPAVFDIKDATLPRDSLHYEGHEEREVHNIYGHMMISSTYAGLRRRNHDERPFILTRSFFAGSQKFAAAWTGDNSATWSMLANSLQMVITSGICGMPFNGADVGGFFGSPDNDLLCRWYQLAAWTYPFFREHCHHESARREPHLFTSDRIQIIREAVNDRYSLLPLWYTLMEEAHRTGNPIVRPLWWHFSDRNDEDIALLGDTILVAPIVKQQAVEKVVTLPQGVWYSYRKMRPARGEIVMKNIKNIIPVFIRGGKIFARKDAKVTSTVSLKKAPYTIVVALNENGTASGSLYIDDEHSFNYEKGEFCRVHFKFENNVLTSTVEGDLEVFKQKISRIEIAGINKAPSVVKMPKYNCQFTYERGVLSITEVDHVISQPIDLQIQYPQEEL
ncbi:Glycosyl hydrolases family 31 protein [Trichomonas vaginalis G3]|uniref:Glucosidase II subunit alpha n=1 Tax=Trichomonas vaginalis (strain ATCC PRA-98 / G3) TaxID=412133 RepID=A2EWL0_TRIV3|nr:glycosyl hydrolase [Trichomonas vaginalis G3]EAY02964.1 Glycosyl hydrolases family 31 protein [Trichomonas vaginalis G3]KAI5492195.1 alpha-glucosidase family [Trichomonas vaginalis G3]|eukprot:XP_001315187.1 glycosyl hydrolase [Trichomonas vaginalis G3]